MCYERSGKLIRACFFQRVWQWILFHIHRISIALFRMNIFWHMWACPYVNWVESSLRRASGERRRESTRATDRMRIRLVAERAFAWRCDEQPLMSHSKYPTRRYKAPRRTHAHTHTLDMNRLKSNPTIFGWLGIFNLTFSSVFLYAFVFRFFLPLCVLILVAAVHLVHANKAGASSSIGR